MEQEPTLDAFAKAVGLILLVLATAACAMPRTVSMRDPLTPEEHINLGVSYERKGELDAALKEYKHAARKTPIAYLYVGNVYFQRGAFNDAEKSYRKAIRKTGSPEAYNNLAWLYYTNGVRLGEAEQLALKAVELAPESEGFRDTLDKIREKENR